jgi:UDP-N-acetylmuramoylalanine--D-glutamate ligase
VILNDRLPLEALAKARQSLEGLEIEWVCGGHPLEVLEGADWVCPSGGVPLDLPLIVEAKRREIPLTNDSQIFLENAPCRVIGITGSAGKTTTVSLVGRIIDRFITIGDKGVEDHQGSNVYPNPYKLPRKVWVGGNIGNPLITVVEEMAPEDLAVMELSSFQLEIMTRSPNIAAILNVTPNHLDRHGTMEAYVAAKARILDFQHADDIAVLNRDDAGAWSLRERIRGEMITFGLSQPSATQVGTFVQDGQILIREQERSVPVMDRSGIGLKGEHNLTNILAACAITYAAGLPPRAMREGIVSFKGIPHRLEFVRSWGGADWYNDSIATAPERSMAAIRSFEEPLILLAGGRDKNLPWEEFAALVCKRVNHLVLFGESAEKIAQVVDTYQKQNLITEPCLESVTLCRNLEEAVRHAANLVNPGSVVLLSPGGTSFDEFHDFEERGEMFKKWVMELP